MNNQLLNRIYPEGWKIIPLAEFAQPTKNSFVDGPFGSDLKVSDYAESGVRVLQLQNLGDGRFINESKIYTTEEKASQIARCIAKPGDLIIAKMADPLARAALLPDVEEKYVIVADLIKLSVGDHVDPFYLTSFINFSDFRREAERRSTGTTRTRISLSTLKRIGVPNPPKYVQRKIARILQTIDHAIEHTSALIGKYQQIKAGLMHDLFTRGIGADGKLRPPREQAPELYQETPIGCIPQEWQSEKIGKACDWFSGGTPSKKNERWWNGTMPWLSPKDMKHFELSDTEDHITRDAALKGSRIVPEGTVFIVVRGMILAHSFPVVFCSREFSFNQDVKAVIAREPIINRFLAYWFVAKTDLFLKKTTESTHGTKRFDMRDLYQIEIGIPQVAEQREIIRRIDTIELKINFEIELQGKLRTKKAGLMQDLLTGKVQVTPNTDAEGAADVQD